MLPLDLLGIPFPRAVHLRVQMPGVCTPVIGIKARETKGIQQRFEPQENLVHLPDIMPPKVETFTRCTSHPRNGHATCSLWRCPSCLPCSAPLPASRAGALSYL